MSTSIYLAVLSVSDSVSLFVGVFTLDSLASDMWFGYNIRDWKPGCLFTEYMYFWAPSVSSWCIVAISLERLIVLLKPHR